MRHIKGIDWILAIGSGVLFFLPFPDFDIYLLAWIAFIPLLFAVEGKTLRQTYLLGIVAGTIGCTGGFYWFGDWARIVLDIPFPLDWLSAVGHGFFAGQVFGLSMLVFQWLRRKNRGIDLILFPMIIVTVFSLYPLLFPFKLGDSQTSFLIAIQAVDLVGVFGLDFMIAFVNILIFCIIQTAEPRPPLAACTVSLLIISSWFGYGLYKLGEWDAKVNQWETIPIGLVQPNRAATINVPKPEAGYSREFPLDMHLSQKLAESGENPIVVWPEGHFYGYYFWPTVNVAFKRHIQSMGVPIIIYDATYKVVSGQKQYYNSSIFIDKNGDEQAKYDKIKLVPFGEYTPVIGKIPLIRDLLGDYQSNLSRGDGNVYFDVNGVTLNPKICYEPLFSEFTADSVAQCPEGCVLLVQSQDGWYGKTSQPAQHTAATILRAVENRVPLIHVINNGPSSVISPNGRVQFQSERHVKGYWVANMPHDKTSGGSFYSHQPRLFLNTIRILLLIYLLGYLVHNFKLKTSISA